MSQPDGEQRKTLLTPEDKDRVWRVSGGRSWPYYAWADDEWRAYPLDPRVSPMNLNYVRASGQTNGCIHTPRGFEEVVL